MFFFTCSWIADVLRNLFMAWLKIHEKNLYKTKKMLCPMPIIDWINTFKLG